jgi:hypothetical protein
MHLRISFNAVVHYSVQAPLPLGDSNYSMGWIRCLKLGMNGDAHNNRPTVCYNSYSVPGSSVPSQFFRLFLASRYEPLHTSTPTIVTLGLEELTFPQINHEARFSELSQGCTRVNPVLLPRGAWYLYVVIKRLGWYPRHTI